MDPLHFKLLSQVTSRKRPLLLFAKPYSPESKGKVERLNGVVQHFLSELALEKVTSFEQLNTWFKVWLSECHQHKPHAAAWRGSNAGNRFSERHKSASFRGCGRARERLSAR